MPLTRYSRLWNAGLGPLIGEPHLGDDQGTTPGIGRTGKPWSREADPRRQLTLLASMSTRIGNRIAALYEVMASAPGSDPEIDAMYQRQQQARYKDQRRLAQSLSREGALRAGLSAAHATDIM